jgi:hypothetical protein
MNLYVFCFLGNVVGAKCLSCGKVGPIKGPKGQQHNIFKFVVKHPPKKEKRERKPKKPSKQMAVRGSGHESTSPSRGTPKDKLDLQFEGWHMDGDAKRTETEREIEEVTNFGPLIILIFCLLHQQIREFVYT